MHLRLYRAPLAAAPFASVFNFSRLRKITDRGMKSRADGKSLNSPYNLTDNEPQLRGNTSQAAYEEEFPPISASISSMPNSKRRTIVDLGSHYEKKSDNKDQSINPLKLDASTSISHENDQYLPSSFGKKHFPSPKNPKIHQTYNDHGNAKGSSKFSPNTIIDEPFDICLPETQESNPDEKLVPEVQPSLENAKQEDNIDDSIEEIGQDEKLVPEVQPSLENAKQEDNIDDSIEEIGQVLRPGMVLFKNYISLPEQVKIVNTCRELGRGPGGFYRPGYDDGAKLRLYMMCLGLDWNPQTKTYGKKRHHDNVTPPQIPQEFIALVSKLLDDSHGVIKQDSNTLDPENILPSMSPDVCIVNFYTTTGRLGLHQDCDESQESLTKRLPVVSISVGDSAEFLYGDQRDVKKAENVLLESGDVLIFGGESRHIFHGVKNITPNTAPTALLENTKLRPGRLNLTFRKY